jgi:phosphoglycolate phosphatase
MPVRLVIFDLDGTLVDTREDITNALNHAVRPLELPAFSVAETTELIGEGLTRLIEKALGSAAEMQREECLSRFLDYYSAHLVDHSVLYPHVIDVLEQMDSMKKAVLSNKRAALSLRLLRELRLDVFFDLIAGSDTTPLKKPDPGAVRYVLDVLRTPPDETVMVGDSHYDIQAGRGAGTRTVAVTYGYGRGEFSADADNVIADISELPRVLGLQSKPSFPS